MAAKRTLRRVGQKIITQNSSGYEKRRFSVVLAALELCETEIDGYFQRFEESTKRSERPKIYFYFCIKGWLHDTSTYVIVGSTSLGKTTWSDIV